MNELNFIKEPEKNTVNLSNLEVGQVISLTTKSGSEFVVESFGVKDFGEVKGLNVKGPMIRVAEKGEGSTVGLLASDSNLKISKGDKFSVKLVKCLSTLEGYQLDYSDKGDLIVKEFDSGEITELSKERREASQIPPSHITDTESFVKKGVDDIMNN